MALANELLGYTYQMKGTVQHGNHLGHKLGFPTMNVMPPARKIMPRYGVYTCRVKVDKTWYNAIGNVGVKPTVTDDPVLLVEAYVYGYEGDAYGKEIIVRFCEFVRPEMKFDGVRELKERLEAGCTVWRKIL